MVISPGDIVYSMAGRDKGRYFAVIAVENEFALICDGRKRKTDKPKRKKVKHLKAGSGHSDFIEQKIKCGIKVTNAEFKAELKPYSEP